MTSAFAVFESYGVLFFEFSNSGTIVAKLFQNLFRIGAEGRRRRGRLRTAAHQAESRADERYLSLNTRRAWKFFNQFATDDLRVVQHFRNRENLTGRHAMLVE